jgi:hypothetical protein
MIRFAHFSRLLLVLGLLLCSGAAWSAVKLEGTWPEVDKPISLDATKMPKSEAVRRIAEAAGWNIVWSSAAEDLVDIHVKKQPATQVLELVLSDGDWVARRRGDLIQIERSKPVADAPVPASPPPLPPPPGAIGALPPLPGASAAPGAAADAGEDDDDDDDRKANPPPSHVRHRHRPDRTVFGGNLRVDKDETVKDVSVLGGTAGIYGTVDGDITVVGGSVHIYPGAHVTGDIGMMGGALRLDDGSIIDGDVNVVGGAVDRAPGAQVHGQVTAGAREHDDEPKEHRSRLMACARSFGGSMTRTAMLFVFGAVLLALMARRMGHLEVEAAERPMRSFALGVVGTIAAAVVFVLLCVTVIGIPVAVVSLLAAIFAAYAGICAVLTAAGSAMLRRWSDNAYLHLAAGCGLFLLVGLIPYVGAIVTTIVVLIGIGTVVATRAAGYIPPRGGFTPRAPEQTASPA